MKGFYKYSKDFTWALGLNRLGLRLLGVWPIDEDSKSQSLHTVLRVPIMIFIIFFCSFLPQLYALALVINKLQLFIENLIASTPTIIACVRLFVIWNTKRELQPVMQSVIEDWLRPKQNWELQVMKRKALWAKTYSIFNSCYLFICWFGFCIAPLLGFNIRTISNTTDCHDRHLILSSRYPYDFTKSPLYEMTNFVQLAGGFLVGLSIAIPEQYYEALVFHTSAQFSILGNKIAHFVRDDEIVSTESTNTDIDKKIGKFIERHIHLIGIVSILEKSFGLLIALQVLCMSMMVFSLGFVILYALGNTGDKPTILPLIVLIGILLNMMLHTFIDCFASETLASSSSNLFFNIYSSNWYMLPKEKVRFLIPMMIISRIPLHIKAGKIFVTSFQMYSDLIKSIGGYISMLIAATGRSTF